METVKSIIIDVLDIKPSEYRERFESDTISDLYKELLEMCTRCYNAKRV